MSTEKSYLESLPIQELVDLRTEIKRQAHEEFSWSSAKDQLLVCREKLELIHIEIERRKDLIK